MTPQELQQNITERRAPIVDFEMESTQEEAFEDLWITLDLLRTSLSQLESVIKVDNDHAFLSKSERADLLDHTAEVLTYLDQWTFDE